MPTQPISEQDEAVYWAAKASDAHRNVLDIVQGSAGKWQAGITAFLGAYATVGFLVGPTTLAGLPSYASKVGVIIVLGLAGGFGLIADVLAYLAANGFPRVLEDRPLTGPQVATNALRGAKTSRRQLRWAMTMAGIAGFFAIVGSFCILAFSLLTSTPAPYAVLVTPTAAYCGTLDTTNGVTSVLLASGKPIQVAGGTMTIVTSCGGS
jgi:hypothetical protein